jgi:hypothetical protein
VTWHRDRICTAIHLPKGTARRHGLPSSCFPDFPLSYSGADQLQTPRWRAGDDGGDHCLALKGNHPLLHAEVERFFADPASEAISRAETVDGDHGRIETRVHAVAHDVDWLFSDRRYTDEPTFPSLAMIGRVERITERGGNTEHTRHSYLRSAKLDAATFGRAVRAHWGV